MSALANSIPRQYDPKEVKLILGGFEPTDVAPDTMYVLNKEEDIVIPSVGVLGEVAIARNRNSLGMLTLSLKNTSPFNKTLAAVIQGSDILGGYFFPIILKAPELGLTIATNGWIQTQPDYSAGKEVGQLDWVFGLANVEWAPLT